MQTSKRISINVTMRAVWVVGAMALTMGATARAQQSGDDNRLEEITVTATRGAKSTNLQTTPISVSAVTSADIDRLVAKDISGLASAVPGFSAARITAFNAASFAMRGVGLTDIIVYQDSPVGVQVDDFVMPSVQTQLLDTFDIANAEVLRGPQGTLFGKNTTGGAVNIRTKRPNMSEFGADIRLGYGSFGAKRLQTAIDLPLQQDVFAVRLVGSVSKSDGYYKLGATYGPINTLNIFGGTFAAFNIPGVTGQRGAGTGATTGGDDVINGRIKAQWNASENLSLLLQVEKLRDRSDAVPSFNDTPPNGPYLWNALGFTRPTGDPLDNMASTQRSDSLLEMDKGQRIDVDGVYLNAEWNLGSHTLFAAAGSRDQDEHLPNTYTGAAPINSITKQPISLFDATRDTARKTRQLEIRLASKSDGPINYVFGAFQQTNDARFCVVQVLGFIDLALPFAALGLPAQFNNNTPQVLCNKQDSSSLAGYADLTFKASDKMTFGAGFRYTKDEREWAGRTQVGLSALDPRNPGLTAAQLGSPLSAGDFAKYPGGQIVNASSPGFSNLKRSWSEPSWRLTGSYQVSDALFSYLTVSRGYKAGGYNDQTGTSGLMVPSLTRPVNPEYATNYELGLKFESADGRLRFNPTVFNTKYEDAQRAVNIITRKGGADFQETVFYNAAEVKSRGVELEMQALLTDSFRIRGQASFLDAKYNKFVINQPALNDPVSGGSIVAFNGNFSGLPVPRSPKSSGAISGTYTAHLAQGNLDVTGEVYYEAKNLFYISAAGRQYDAYLNEKTLLNLSATYTPTGNQYFVRVYGKNLSDERYRVASQSVATLWTHTQWGAPRSFGVEVGFNLGASGK